MKAFIPKIIGFFINLFGVFSSKYAAQLAISLFSSPKKGNIKPNEAEYLNDAIHENIACNDITIKTYRWTGNKETILLAHGWESNTYRWKKLINILKDLDYNVIALDAPAHGDSTGKIFNALIYAECINKVAKKFEVSTIIGHSVGGMATVIALYNAPLSFTNKIVLLGAPSNFTGVFSRYKNMMGYSQKVSYALDQYILKNFNHLPDYFSTSNFSKELKAKGLVIHDEEDKIIPFQDGLDFKLNYSNATFISTKGFGHGLKSDSIYNHIIHFLKS
ncbi:alpha/beta fold hydrolase [Postechiella marina]|uniref:Alpha/beta fold hydrolase n=1 Tax=Postechiella marina TaxID=943941 RepID=A0ABP8C9K8_9FLAO